MVILFFNHLYCNAYYYKGFWFFIIVSDLKEELIFQLNVYSNVYFTKIIKLKKNFCLLNVYPKVCFIEIIKLNWWWDFESLKGFWTHHKLRWSQPQFICWISNTNLKALQKNLKWRGILISTHVDKRWLDQQILEDS